MADTFTVPPDASSTSDSSLDQGTLISDVSPITSSPQKPSAPSPTVVIARPTQNRDFSQSVPKDALNRAYHTLDFYQRNPNWLADPDTMHAAQLDLANSSKLIEMSIQLGRVGSQAASVKLTNDFTKKRQDALSSISQFVPINDTDGQGELGRLNAMATKAGTPDFNLEEFSRGVAALESRYSPAGKPDSLTMSDGSVLQGYRDKNGNFHQSQIQVNEAKDKAVLGHIEQRFKNQKEILKDRYGYQKNLMQDREFLKTLSLDTNTRLKRIDEDYKAASREVEKLRKDGAGEDDPKLLTAIGRQHLIAKRQSDVLEAMSPSATANVPTATQPSAPSQSPYKEGTRLTGPGGKIYVVKDGQPVPE